MEPETLFEPIKSAGLHSYCRIRESLCVRFRGNPERVYVYENVPAAKLAEFERLVSTGQGGNTRHFLREIKPTCESRRMTVEDFMVVMSREAAERETERKEQAERGRQVIVALQKIRSPAVGVWF